MIILETMGVPVKLIADVGAVGIHRLSNVLPDILSASVCSAYACMDALLVSALGGLFPGPVIAVLVSTGYDAAAGALRILKRYSLGYLEDLSILQGNALLVYS